MRYLFIITAIVAVLAATITTAQPTYGETALLNAGGSYGNALVGMGRYGNITTILPLPAGNPTGIAVHDRGGPDLIVDGYNLYEYKDGVLRTLTASLAMPALDVTVMEDSGYAFAATTHILWLNRFLGKRGTLASGFKRACAISVDGNNGALMVVDDVAETITEIDGSIVTGSIPVKGPRCTVWDPYTGNMFLACKGVLYHVTPGGAMFTLSEGTPGLDAPVGLFLRSDRTLLIAQGVGGGSNAHPGLYAYHGDTGQFNRALYETTDMTVGLWPTDITVEHSRDLWPKSAAVVGQPLDITVNFPIYKNWPFLAALSFGHEPGLQLGWYTLHLVPDALFFASLNTPALFQSQGILSSGGNATIRLNIPDIDELAGLRIFCGVVVPDANRRDGIGVVSYPMGFTIQKKTP